MHRLYGPEKRGGGRGLYGKEEEIMALKAAHRACEMWLTRAMLTGGLDLQKYQGGEFALSLCALLLYCSSVFLVFRSCRSFALFVALYLKSDLNDSLLMKERFAIFKSGLCFFLISLD